MNRHFLFGALIAAGSIIPLYGRILGVPSVALSAMFLIAATLAIPGRHHLALRGIAPSLVVVGLFLVYAALVALASSPEQWAYFLTPNNWLHHADDYVDSKLLMFVVTAGPGFMFGVLYATFARQSETTFQGLTIGTVAVGLAASIHTGVDGYHLLAGTDYMVAREFILDKTREFSTVSYGILFMLAGAFAITHRTLWPLTGVFLFMAAWLDRKAETVMILCFVISTGILQRNVRRAFAVAVIALAMFIPLHNESNVATWRYVGNNIKLRIAVIENKKLDPSTLEIQRLASGLPGPDLLRLNMAAAAPPAGDAPQVKPHVNYGLGAYALNSVTDGVVYPHNIIVEAYEETGLVSAIFLILLFAAGLWPAGKCYIVTRERELLPVMFALTGVFAASLKAGDITNVGRILFFALLCSSMSTRYPSPQPTNVAEPCPLPSS